VGEVWFGERDGKDSFVGSADGAGVEVDLIAVFVRCQFLIL
jgi:hypothetical protein